MYHLRDLSHLLFFGLLHYIINLSIVIYFYYDILYLFMAFVLSLDVMVIYTKFNMALLSYTKFVCILSLLISSPYLLFLWYQFMLPGLYVVERVTSKYMIYLISYMISLYVWLIYIAPALLQFYLAFDNELITAQILISDLIDFWINCFLLPLFIVILPFLPFSKNRRLIYTVIIVTVLIVTTPSIMSVILTGIVIIMYEISIIIKLIK